MPIIHERINSDPSSRSEEVPWKKHKNQIIDDVNNLFSAQDRLASSLLNLCSLTTLVICVHLF